MRAAVSALRFFGSRPPATSLRRGVVFVFAMNMSLATDLSERKLVLALCVNRRHICRMTTESLGAYLRMCRERNGWSRAELAGKVGAAERSVERWEAGHTTPSLADATRLSRALRVPLARISSKLVEP